MDLAVQRLLQARDRQEAVTIWGDFDADGVTATAVLWEGLQQFIPPPQLDYTIPNRLTESHGVSVAGIERLHAAGCRLVVTCDTGSTSLAAIARAQELGIDIIVTDHHTLPAARPPVVAMLNPRTFLAEHPLATLSGVAVAYKLVEALYLSAPEIPSAPLENLLDLVAIGLVADLVELRGDVRYLAQLGIQQLKRQARPAVRLLLNHCKRAGDRAMDIAFGLGPRINAVSRIHGDARSCVAMLTANDEDEAREFVAQTELANTRRRELQKRVLQEAQIQLEQRDLSTEGAILLASSDWPAGVLGIVAGQLAQDYSRPAVLLRIEGDIALGSARSVAGIDLYDLLQGQDHLLHSFGGHPLAAGLRLPAENLPLLARSLNYALRQSPPPLQARLSVDLEVTIERLGQDLFRQLAQLEPFGMGNSVPRLLVRNARFEGVFNRNSRDLRGKTVQFIYTTFELRDRTGTIAGIWWGHYAHEVPQVPCDVVVELDYMAAQRHNKSPQNKSPQFGYQVRLVDLRPTQVSTSDIPAATYHVVDLRQQPEREAILATVNGAAVLHVCPSRWTDIFRAARPGVPLVLAYDAPLPRSPQTVWYTLVGWAKALSTSGETASQQRWAEALQVSTRTLDLGLQALATVGFSLQQEGDRLASTGAPTADHHSSAKPVEAVAQFRAAIEEEAFQQRYFFDIDPEAIAATLNTPAISEIAVSDRLRHEVARSSSPLTE
jgi:single-stranded-DNA-specific exonuclease